MQQNLRAALANAALEKNPRAETMELWGMLVETCEGDWTRDRDNMQSALQSEASAHSLRLSKMEAQQLAQHWVTELWKANRGTELDAYMHTEPVPVAKLQAEATALVTSWAKKSVGVDKETAQITSFIEAEGRFQRLQLTDATIQDLTQLVREKLRYFAAVGNVCEGDDIMNIVKAVVLDWKRQLMQEKVAQTIWDTDDNSLVQSSRTNNRRVRFMPFRHDGVHGRLDVNVLSLVFAMLDYRTDLVAASMVCQRWRQIALSNTWMPELLVFVWGHERLTMMKQTQLKPQPLPFSRTHQVWQLSCSDSATFALTTAGHVYHWGRGWTHQMVVYGRANRINELNDVISVSCTPPGYYHGRDGQHFGDATGRAMYSCCAVTRQGELFVWGANRFDHVYPRPPHHRNSYSAPPIARPLQLDVNTLESVVSKRIYL